MRNQIHTDVQIFNKTLKVYSFFFFFKQNLKHPTYIFGSFENAFPSIRHHGRKGFFNQKRAMSRWNFKSEVKQQQKTAGDI